MIRRRRIIPCRRMILLIIIMIAVSLIIESVTITVLYRAAIKEREDNLRDIVTSQARLIESMARFDKSHNKDYPGSPTEATLSQLVDAHSRYKGFGRTGELTLAKRMKNDIVFILNHRHLDLNHPKPVPFNSTLAEPSRLALSGKSGTIVGLDYRGEKVLAAYEPLSELGWGIVAKIDLSEVREPFIRAGLISAVLGIMIIIIGSIIFFIITEPLIRELHDTIADLQAAMDNVKQLSGLLPICASCKKIRDDKGYWTQIESYIHDHSEAQFSHGICPDCAKKLYGDLPHRQK